MLSTFIIGFLCLVILSLAAILVSVVVKIVRRILER